MTYVQSGSALPARQAAPLPLLRLASRALPPPQPLWQRWQQRQQQRRRHARKRTGWQQSTTFTRLTGPHAEKSSTLPLCCGGGVPSAWVCRCRRQPPLPPQLQQPQGQERTQELQPRLLLHLLPPRPARCAS